MINKFRILFPVTPSVRVIVSAGLTAAFSLTLLVGPATNGALTTVQSASSASETAGFTEGELLDLLFINSFETNQPPQIISPARRYASPLHSYEYPVEVFDAEDDPVLFALAAGPAGMEIDLFSGEITWPSPVLGAHSVEIIAQDIFGGFDTQSWTLTVAENSPPQILSSPPIEAQAGEPWDYLPEVVDPDLEMLTYSLTTAPVGMGIDPATGRMDWLPDTAGEVQVEWRVTDPAGALDTQAFTISVAPPADTPPTITSTPPVEATIDQPWVYPIQAEDPNDNIDAYRLVEAPVGMQIDPETGRVEWTPAGVQPAAVTIEVLDTTGLFDRQSFTVTVSATPGTTPPEWQGPSALVAPLGRTSTFQLAAFDADGDALRYFVEPLPLPAGMEFSSLTGELAFTPSLDQVGELELEFAASDGRFRIHRQFTISVPPPDGPTRLRGRVMHGLDEPLPGVRLAIGEEEAFAGPDGYFDFPDLPVSGEVTLLIDGSTAELPGTFATVPKVKNLIPGVGNLMQDPIILMPLDTDSADLIIPGTTSEIDSAPVIKNGEEFAPVTLTIPPNTATWEETGEPFSGQMHITDVADNALSPQPLPRELDFSVYVAMQPFGVVYDEPVPISFPNVEDLLPGTRMEIFGLDHDTGEFVKFGDAEVSGDGQTVDSIGGVVVANSWHGVAFNPPEVESEDEDNRDETDCECGSTVGLTEGNLNVTHATPSYRSLGQARGVTLSYNHITADAKPIVRFQQGNAFFSISGPATSSASLNVGGVAFSPKFSWEGSTETAQGAIQFDAAGCPSEVYDFELEVTSSVPGGFGSRTTTVGGKLALINLAESPFGKGWHIRGLEEIMIGPTGDALIIDGRSQGTIFRWENGGFTSPDGDFSTLALTGAGLERTFSDGTVKAFSLDGLLLAEQDRNGNSTTYAYDEHGRLLTITDPVGLQTSFEYFAGMLTSISDPAGRITRFEHDAFGNLTRIIEPDSGIKTFNYDEAKGRMLGRTDQRGFTTEYQYNQFGRLEAALRPDGSNPISRATAQVGLIDPATNNGTEENPAQAVSTDDVDALLFDGNGNLTRFKIDARGRITERVDAIGRVKKTERDDDSNPTRTEHPDGSVVTRTFDSRGNVLTETELANGATITASYDSFSQITSLTDPRGNVFTIERDEFGNPVSATNPAGHVTTFEHNEQGLVTRITDPNGAETSRDYNARGLLVREIQTTTEGRARETTFEYDAAGNVTAVVTPEGAWLTFSYDAEGRLASALNDRGERLEFDYDLRGNRLSSRLFNADSSLALQLASVYDERDRQTELRLPHTGSEESIFQFAYDGEGNLAGQIDPNGRTTLMDYDAVDRMMRQTDPAGGVTSIDYTLRDRVERVVAPNGATTDFQYDGLARRTEEQSPDRGAIELAYDLADNLVASTDARDITREIEYDALNRPIGVAYPDPGEDVTLTWDTCSNGVGRLCRVEDDSGIQTLEYDGFGNIVRVTRIELGIDYVTEYEYDLEDRVTAIVYPSGRRVEYQRDILGRVTEVRAEVAGQMQPMLSNITYRADGQIISAEYGNGLAELREYDGQGRLVGKELIDSAGFVVEERTWAYDPAGNVVERTRSSATETFSYDPLDRLVGQDITSASDASWSYDYGSNHNRLSRQLEGEFGEDYAYQPQSNRLLRRTRPTPASPPPEGIYQRKSSYNQAGRLSAYSENGDVKARYTYNTFGLRTRKETDAGTKVFHYDTGITLLGESDQAGNATRDYIWLNGSPVAAVDAGGTVAFIHTDHLFTPRLATDPTGTIVWSWEGEVFGDTEPTGSLTLNLRFPGQYFDVESGRNYNVMRDYDAALGRYVQSDPIGSTGGSNSYVYVAANPVNQSDITGLNPAVGAALRLIFEVVCTITQGSIGERERAWDDRVRRIFDENMNELMRAKKAKFRDCNRICDVQDRLACFQSVRDEFRPLFEEQRDFLRNGLDVNPFRNNVSCSSLPKRSR